jgi:hypothetical protein
MRSEVLLFVGEALLSYGFPDGHPFSVDRQGAFWKEAQEAGLGQARDARRAAAGEQRRAACASTARPT